MSFESLCGGEPGQVCQFCPFFEVAKASHFCFRVSSLKEERSGKLPQHWLFPSFLYRKSSDYIRQLRQMSCPFSLVRHDPGSD